jgi:hypothetical protein
VELLGKEMVVENTNQFVIKKKTGNIPFIILSPLKSKIEPIKKTLSSGSIFVNSYKIQDYIPIPDDEGFYKRPTSSLRFSGLMLLRFGLDEASVEKFMALNNLRNTIVAHSANNSTAEITEKHVIQLAESLEQVFKKL